MAKNKRLIAEIIQDQRVIMTIDDNMLSCGFGSLDRGSLTDVVDWGIYANRGYINFIDTVGYFGNKNNQFLRSKQTTVKFYISNNNTHVLASSFYIDNFDYDEESKQVNIELISRLSRWQSMKMEESIYPFESMWVDDLISIVNERFSTGITNQGVSEHIIIETPYFAPDNLWNVVRKICQATMSRVIEDEGGKPIISDTFPQRNPIVITPKNIISIPTKSFVSLPNRSIDATYRVKSYDEEATIPFEIGWSGYQDGENEILYHSGIKMTFQDFGEATYAIARGVFKSSDKMYWNFPSSKPMFYLNGSWQLTDFGTNTLSNYKYSSSLEDSSIYEAERIDDNSISFSCRTNVRLLDTALNRELTLQSGSFVAKYSSFSDSLEKFVERYDKEDSLEPVSIPTNDLVQTESYYIDEENPLPQYILYEVGKRYGNGIDCFEIECLFNEYYDENGNLVFDGKDLYNRFRNYDIVVPYVTRGVEMVPLRTNEDGTPKKFRVIGISYSYDGLLKQKLQLQEERYDAD